MKTLKLTIVAIGFMLLTTVPAIAEKIDVQAIERLNTDDMYIDVRP